jgi:hypothetical protein
MADDDLTDDDKRFLKRISDSGSAAEGTNLLAEYYGDRDRADRTPREFLYLHMGLLAGFVQSCLELQSDEDRCRYCGTRIGFGLRAFHLGLCEGDECQAKAAKDERPH